MSYVLTPASIILYAQHLREEERSETTIQKYVTNLQRFYRFLPPGKEVTKDDALLFKAELSGEYAASTVNGAVAALNGFFHFSGWPLELKPVKCQKRIFADQERELSLDEYLRLLTTAKQNGNQRLYLILQAICSTGIRVSELPFITVNAVRTGRAEVNCKGKRRTIFIPHDLCAALEDYAAQADVRSGPVFVTRGGQPVDRSRIWADMKRLCKKADVDPGKVFPHNLRHLFARRFYQTERDIAKLADLLGHTSIDTTRIYLMESGAQHERIINGLGLLQL